MKTTILNLKDDENISRLSIYCLFDCIPEKLKCLENYQMCLGAADDQTFLPGKIHMR